MNENQNNETPILDSADSALSFARTVNHTFNQSAASHQASLHAKDLGAHAAAGTAKELGTQSAKEVGKQVGKQAVKEVGKEVGKEVAKEAVKEVAKGTAAAAASGGTLALPMLAIKGAKILKSIYTAQRDEMFGTSPEKSGSFGKGLTIGVATFIVLISVITSLVPAAIMYVPVMINRELSNLGETFYNKFTDKGKYFKELFGRDSYTVELNNIVKQSRQIDEQNIEIYKDIIDEAIYQAFNEYAKLYITTPLGDIDITPIFQLIPIFNFDKVEEKYLSLEYPYTLAKNGEFYTIEEFLNGDIPESELNNDLNYAEIIAVLCQNPQYSSQFFSYSSFYDLLTSNKVAHLLFEVKLSDVIEYEYTLSDGTVTSSAPVSDSQSTTNTVSSVSYYREGFVAPYGLRELYMIAEISPYESNYAHPSLSNIDVLDDNEGWLRARFGNSVDLGPAYNQVREPKSFSYALQITDGSIPVGRSSYSYFADSLNSQDTFAEADDRLQSGSSYIYIPKGTAVILEMPQYICQGDYPYSYRGTDGKGDTIKKSGCIDCSYSMCAAYYQGQSVDVKNISSNYVHDNLFDSNSFLAAMELTQHWNESFSVEAVTSYLTQGYPVIFYLNGLWEYEENIAVETDGIIYNTTVTHQYHTGSRDHFMVIIGYDEKGFYVLDPGKKANNSSAIPYAAFEKAYAKMVRPIIPLDSDFVPRYACNTLIN